MQHIANLPHTFTYDKDVMKSYYACMQCAIQSGSISYNHYSPKWEQKGEKHGHMRNEFSHVSAEIEKIISSSSKCSSTSSWINHNGCSSSKPNINVHTIWSVGKSKHLDSIVMGNHEELKDVNIISTIFVDSTESYNIKTTFVDKYLFLNC